MAERRERRESASTTWTGGEDAASMKPRLIPDFELLPRDDSGGADWQPYNQEFGDGGYVTGPKAHLSVRGGKNDDLRGDEQDSTLKARDSKKNDANGDGDDANKRARRMARE